MGQGVNSDPFTAAESAVLRSRALAVGMDDADRKRFLETLAEAVVKTEWQVHTHCLMANHFHLVVETPQANLIAGMKWFLGTCTSRFNRRQKLLSHGL
jgi:putative transposase